MKLNNVKKLFKAKRIIALALAAAMTVTSVPQTAYAAEAETTAIEAQEADNAGEDANAGAEEKAQENAEAGAFADVQDNADDAAQDEAADNVQIKEQEAEADEAVNQAEGDAAAPEVTYTLSDKIESDVKSAEYHNTSPAFTQGGSNKPNSHILFGIIINGGEDGEKRILEKDQFWEGETGLSDDFTYKWQTEGADKAAADTETPLIPADAGKYQLVVTPKADSDYKSAQPLVITGFEIKKAKMAVSFDIDSITPGTEKGKVKDSIQKVTVSGGGAAFYYDSAAENNTNQIEYEVKVLDPSKEAETGDAFLKKNGDYEAEVKVVKFTDKVPEAEQKNYELPASAIKRITVAELKATAVKLSGITGAVTAYRSDNNKPVSVLKNTYNVNAAEAPKYDTPVVEDMANPVKDDKGEIKRDASGNIQYNAVPNAKVSGKWHTAEFRSWTESVPAKEADGTDKKDDKGEIVYEDRTYCSLTVGGEIEENKAPTEAGTYVYRVTYEGDEAQYAASSADIVYEITPLEVTVKPAAEGASFYAGESVKDVLSKITYKAVGSDNKEIKDIWGTSYDDSGRTQPYEPVFGVYKVTGGTAVQVTGSLAKAEGVTYEVRFTGKKAVYPASGNTEKGINDSTVDAYNGNYTTKTDDETIKTAKLDITLGDRKAAAIDTTAIESTEGLTKRELKMKDSKDDIIIFTKVYDEKPLFASRDAYKKAKVTAEGADSAKLDYKWYKWNSYTDVDAAYVDLYNKEANITSNWTSLSINNNDFNAYAASSLKNAGIYKLVVTYSSDTAYGQKNVYFAIERQQLRFVPTAVRTAYYGTSMSQYIDVHKSKYDDFKPQLQKLPDNKKDGIWEDTGWITKQNYIDLMDNEYWTLQERAPKTEAQPNPDWGYAGVFTKLETGQNDYRMKYDVEHFYAYGDGSVSWVDSRINSENYTFYKCTAKDVTEKDQNDAETVTGKKLDIENLSVADITDIKEGSGLTLVLPEKRIEATKVYDGKAIEVDLSGVKYQDKDKKDVDVLSEFRWVYNSYDGEYRYEVKKEEAVNAGTYEIYAYYSGNGTYASTEETLAAVAAITPRELTVSVKQPSQVFAGESLQSAYSDYSWYDEESGNLTRTEFGDMLEFDGVADKDKDAFIWKKQYTVNGRWMYGYAAWADREVYQDGTDYYYEYCHPTLGFDEKESTYCFESGKTYKLRVTEEGSLAYPYYNNYTIKLGAAKEVKPEYAPSTVWLHSYKSEGGYNSDSELKSYDDVNRKANEGALKFEHVITFHNSVPYAPCTITREDGKTETVYGHYATVVIEVPTEFSGNGIDVKDTAFYENALKNAGAFILPYDDYGKVWAVFDLSKDGTNGLEPKDDISFSIVWKEGFVEKFTIKPSKENLAADLRNAVAPKSLAFNSPKTKMVVGEAQDLDVKITKFSNDDLIYLEYDVDKKDVLAVSSQGRITALKEGAATVTVYPVKIDGNKKVKIEGAKAALAKIAVSKVAAPKISAVIPADEWVTVQYPYVKNNGRYYDYGYRREVYLMRDKKTAAEFETAIKKYEQTGDLKAAGFEAAPVYVDNDTEKAAVDYMIGLGRTEVWYTSGSGYAIGCIASGKNVNIQVKIKEGLNHKTPYSVYVRNVSAQRTAADKDGNVRTAELSANGSVKDFNTTLGQVKRIALASGESANKDVKKADLYYYYDYNGDLKSGSVDYYEYSLTTGTTQLTAKGFFREIADEVAGAERPDIAKEGYVIPFEKKETKNKLVEPKLEYRVYQITQNEAGEWFYLYDDYYDEVRHGWMSKKVAAKYTKADAKGKLTFTQPEALAVRAYDPVTKIESAPIIVRIKADTVSAAVGAVTLQVGQSVPVVDLVAYKSGNSALDSQNWYFDHTASAEINGNAYFKTDEYGSITPVKFDKTAAKQTVTVNGTPTVSGAAAVTIKDLDPVKNVKFKNLIDNSFVLDFAPSIYADGYVVEIRNAAGNLVQRKYISQYDYSSWDDDVLRYNDGFIWYYSESKKRYVLLPDNGYENWFKFGNLKPQCKYSVSVTAVYDGYASKTVTAAAVTTKIPAADSALEPEDWGGMPINVFAYGALRSSASGYPFISGNRYTLVANANTGSEYAVTDKLTWSISDAKVAKISALGGTYTASLKALKPGTAVIEVKSGILKQTIARWTITVKAVGDAYNHSYFYDENEDLRGDGTNDGKNNYNTDAKLILNVPASVELEAGKSMTYAFTAEEAGSYKIVKSAGLKADLSVTYLSNMTEGQTSTVTVTANNSLASGTITVEKVSGTEFKDRIPLKLNESVPLGSGAYGVFTARAEGLYTFSVSGETNTLALYKAKDKPLPNKSYNSVYYYMKKDSSIYVKSNGTDDVTVELVSMEALETDKSYTVEKNVEKDTAYWYTFTAQADGDYRFKTETGNASFKLYKDIDEINSESGSSMPRCELKKDEKVYVRIGVNKNGTDSTFKVIKKEPVVINPADVPAGTAGKRYTVESNDVMGYTLTPDADAVYTFTLNSSSSVSKISISLDGKDLMPEPDRADLSCLLEKGKKYSITVDNSSYEQTITLTVTKSVVASLSETDTAGKEFAKLNLYASTGVYGYLTFTVPEGTGGGYKFTLTSSGSYAEFYVAGEPSDDNQIEPCIARQYISSNTDVVECYLQAGQKVWLRWGRDSYDVVTGATCKVEKTGEALQQLPDNKEVTVPAGKTAWYSYKVPESAKYEFGDIYGLNVRLYKSLDNQDETMYTGTEYYLEKDSTVYLKLTNEGSTEINSTITADKNVPVEWTDLTQPQTISAGQTKWYKVTADGAFKLEANQGSYVNVECYTENEYKSNAQADRRVLPHTYLFKAGETAYLKVYEYYADATMDTTTITAASQTLQALSLDNSTDVTITQGGALVEFAVPQTGIYTFENTAVGAYLQLYDDKDMYNLGQNTLMSGDDSINCPLAGGTTVYLSISNIGESVSSYNVSVTKDNNITMEEMTLGAEKTVDLSNSQEKWFYLKLDAADQDTGYKIEAVNNTGINNYLYVRYQNSFNGSNWQDSMSSTYTSWVTNGSSGSGYLYLSSSGGKLLVMRISSAKSYTGDGKFSIKITKNNNN